MNPPSDFYREILQRLLANAFAVQERRELTELLRSTQLNPKATFSPEPLISQESEEIAPQEEMFVPPPQFLMLPENEHSLYARYGHILAEIVELPGFRHSARLATMFARTGKQVTAPVPPLESAPPAIAAPTNARPPIAIPTVAPSKIVSQTVPRFAATKQTTTPRNRRPDFTPARVFAVFARRAQNLHWPNRWRTFTPKLLATHFSVRGKDFSWSKRWRRLVPTAIGARIKQRATSFSWLKRFRSFTPPTVAAALRQRAKSLNLPGRWRQFNPVSVVAESGRRVQNVRWPRPSDKFSLRTVQTWLEQRTKNFKLPSYRRNPGARTVTAGARKQALHLHWADLGRNLAPAAVIAIVLGFTVLLLHKDRGPVKTMESSLQAPNAPSTVDRQPTLAKPRPGKITVAAKAAPTSPQQSEPAKSGLKRVRVRANEVDYIGDDVTVRTFTDKRVLKRGQPPNGRVANIGDDVTVRYFGPRPPTRSASR